MTIRTVFLSSVDDVASLLSTFMLDFAGVGFLGAMHTVSRVETWAEHFLLTLAVTSAHGFDHIVKPGFLFFLFHDIKSVTNTVPIHFLALNLQLKLENSNQIKRKELNYVML